MWSKLNLAAMKSKVSGVFNAGAGGWSFNEVVAELNRVLKTDLKPDYFENPYGFTQDWTETDQGARRREDRVRTEARSPRGNGALSRIRQAWHVSVLAAFLAQVMHFIVMYLTPRRKTRRLICGHVLGEELD